MEKSTLATDRSRVDPSYSGEERATREDESTEKQ